MSEKILTVNDLVINFKTDSGILHAVRNINFDLERGETLCIVGESGSGKSVTAKAIMGILANNAIIENGSIMYRGENLLEISEDQFYKIRGHKIGMIFQDPLSSLNPIVRIGKQITEAMLINSNKLKLMYDDLISDDLIAYKNKLAKARIQCEKLTKHFNTEVYELEHNDELTKEEKQANKKIIAEKKKALKLKIKEIKDQAKIDAKPLKEKLDETKKNAKVEVEKYKKSVLEEHSRKMMELKAKLLDANNEEEIKEAKKLIEEEKIACTNKLKLTKSEAKRRALAIMKEVGIPEPERRFRQYPFEFSGGMRQRIVIAIALTAAPEILICDEPTTALDVTIQAQILELINKIKKERNLSCIFITHDLGVVANMANRVAVMYAGKIVEYGTAEDIFFDTF